MWRLETKMSGHKYKANDIKKSAMKLAKLICSATGVLEIHKKKLLNELIWKITEADGKYKTRFISEGVKKGYGPIQHEHVIPRKELIRQILRRPKNIERILNNAVACLVTKKEHQSLTKLSSGKKWGRYRSIGIRIYDQKKEQWLV